MKKVSSLFVLASICVGLSGCDQKTNPPSGGEASATADAHQHDAADHGHDHAGHDHDAVDHASQHGGQLIELGHDHAYHAELVDDHDSESVRLYLMDADMKPLTSAVESVNMKLTSGEETKSFELSADTAGVGQFRSNDASLLELLDEEGMTGKLTVMVEGKPVSGSFIHFEHHEHDHDGHDHADHE